MKIKYKTVVDEEGEAYCFTPMSTQTWCCNKLEDAVIAKAITLESIGLFLTAPEPYEDYTYSYSPPIKFCPFCGEVVDSEEVKKVKKVERMMTVKAQPARQEKRWVEVEVK